MDITRKAIVERLAQLQSEQEQTRATLVQIQANLNAYDGAIQECSFWLTQLDAEEAKQVIVSE